MKARLLAFAAASVLTFGLAAHAAPADPARPSPVPTVTPTLPTAPEDATKAAPAMPTAPAAPAATAVKAVPPPPTDDPPASAKQPAPAFRAGAKVSDSTGAQIGVIQSIAEASTGAMVVLNVDGKLVSVPQGTLAPFGENVKSSQTKAQILAAAPKP